LEIHEIPGDHRGILYEPQVENLAERLKSRIDQIGAKYERTNLLEPRASKQPTLGSD
jgi:hypothetical protein